MADFLVKRGGPARVTLVIPTDKGRATVSLPVTPHGQGGRVSVPDEHAGNIDPKHARYMVRLAPAEPAEPEVEFTSEPENTRPDLPATVGKRTEHVEG